MNEPKGTRVHEVGCPGGDRCGCSAKYDPGLGFEPSYVFAPRLPPRVDRGDTHHQGEPKMEMNDIVTVHDLIARLSQFPPEKLVFAPATEGVLCTVELSAKANGEIVVQAGRPVIASVKIEYPPDGPVVSEQVKPTKFENLAVEQVLFTSKGGELQTCFRAYVPPFMVVFEQDDGRWKATLKCAASKGGATGLVTIIRERIPEYAWIGLCNHAVALALSEEGPRVGRDFIAKCLAWVDANRREYAGKWVALKAGELVDSDESEDALQHRLEDRADGLEFIIMKVEAKP